MIQEAVLDDQPNKLSWAFEKGKKYSVRSMYRLITFGGLSMQKWKSFGKAKFL